MTDDRQLRDELEKVQSEVLRLERALEQPESLHADQRARIDGLRRSRAQQQQKLDEMNAQLARLDEELREVMSANAELQSELNALQRSERTLVSATIGRLDPGASRAGCSVLLVAAAALAAVGWLT